MLVKTAGVFAFGDSITMADLALVPQVYNAERYVKPMTYLVVVPCSFLFFSGLMDRLLFRIN